MPWPRTSQLLPVLAAQLDLPLPAVQLGSPVCRPRSSPDPPGPSTGFSGSLDALGEVRVRLARTAALLDQLHPLGRPGLPAVG